ncbi:chondroadherin-like [Onthophagus taurus]|uniref:chondroadherin-like n=1 Tax=Onthophagus taurus TaxID=166361 RepID=UPI0039BEC348
MFSTFRFLARKMTPIFRNFLVFSSLILGAQASGCLQHSFNNVSVTVVGVRGVDRISGCLEPIGTLEKVSYVQIINQTVPVLYKDAVRDLQYLVDFVLDGSQVASVERGSFSNLPLLKLLRLKDNKIREIREGVFNDLMITELNLSNNDIVRIERGALDRLPNLEVVNFDRNRIQTWNEDWFLQTPNVNTLSFQENEIKRIPRRAFQNVHGTHQIAGRKVMTNIFLNNNLISDVDPKSLEGISALGWLFLNKNEIRVIPDDFLDNIEQIDWLKLNFNQLNCLPEKIFDKVPNVVNYLEGNPLNEDCKTRFKL